MKCMVPELCERCHEPKNNHGWWLLGRRCLDGSGGEWKAPSRTAVAIDAADERRVAA
jgi:hypothetical protein